MIFAVLSSTHILKTNLINISITTRTMITSSNGMIIPIVIKMITELSVVLSVALSVILAVML